MSYGIRSHVKDVSDLAAKLIADLLAVVKRNEAFFKSRGQILVMVTPQDVKPWYFRFQQRVFCSVVSVINPVWKGKYRRSGSAITINNVCISPSLAHNKLYFNWTNLRCHAHPNCNPDVPEDLRTVADSFIDAL